MLKAVIALFLIASVAAGNGGVNGIIQWLQEHGAEALETAEECLAVGDVMAKLQESCNEPDSTRKSLVGLAVWGLVEGMEASECPIAKELANTSIAKTAKEMGVAAVMETTHEQLDSFCGKAQCKDLLHQFGTAYAQCYGRSICAALAHADFLAYEDCKPIMTSFTERHMEAQSRLSCAHYSSHGIYCPEVQTGLLLKDPVCYSTLFGTVTDNECVEHADCVQMWKGSKQDYPYCSRMIGRQAHATIQSTLEMMRTLLAKAKDPEMREAAKNVPGSLPLFLESCQDDVAVKTINV